MVLTKKNNNAKGKTDRRIRNSASWFEYELTPYVTHYITRLNRGTSQTDIQKTNKTLIAELNFNELKSLIYIGYLVNNIGKIFI